MSTPQRPLDDTDLPGVDQPSSGGEPPRMPRWVKVFGAIAVLLVVVVALKLALDGGGHGPGMHSGMGSTAPLPVSAPGPLVGLVGLVA